MRIPSLVIIAPVVAAATLTGCGSSSNSAGKSSSTTASTTASAGPAVDIAGIEARIATALTKPGPGGNGPQTENPTVKCPTNVVAKPSQTFTCDVTAKEGRSGPQPGAPMTGTAEVTLQDATGQQFQLHVKLASDAYSIEIRGPG
jgi:Domain of unknown function (DUF4333)